MYKVEKKYQGKKLSKKTNVGTIAIDLSKDQSQEKLTAYSRYFPEAIKFVGEEKKESKKEDSKDEKKK